MSLMEALRQGLQEGDLQMELPPPGEWQGLWQGPFIVAPWYQGQSQLSQSSSQISVKVISLSSSAQSKV